jgi:hypothetical protein
MTQADSVHSTPRKTAFKIVGGTDCAPPLSEPDATAPSTAQGKRKKRGAYQGERRQIEYQDGLPIIDPIGEADPIFHEIARHRDAAAHYERCVTIEGEAEGVVSDNEYFHLQRNTNNAFEDMMLFARALILRRPTTRRGLIHQARYLASQITDPDGCASGGPNLPDHIGVDEKPWPLAFPAKPRRRAAQDGWRARRPGRRGGGMSDVVPFPGAIPVPEVHTERDEDEIHAEAFRDLECHIGDCVCMGKIASEAMANVRCNDEKLAFAVFHLTEMLLNLQKHYKAAQDGGNALAYRLIRHPAKSTEEIKEALISLPAEDQP